MQSKEEEDANKYQTILNEKQQLQAEFDLIKASWIQEKNHYKTTIAELEKSSRQLLDRIRILEEKNVSSEEKLLQFQRVTESQEVKSRDISIVLKNIQKNYVLRRGILEYKIRKVVDSFIDIKGKLKTVRGEVLTLKEEHEKTVKQLQDYLQEHLLRQNVVVMSQTEEISGLKMIEKTQKETINDLHSRLKDSELRLKALMDVMRNFESSGSETSNKLTETQSKLVEKNELVDKLTVENKEMRFELSELKEMFFLLQENQQEELLKLMTKSSGTLLTYSRAKELEKSEDLKKLRLLEKEIGNYKPKIRSPKLDLILQQQRSLIAQIKDTTERCNVREFEVISPLKEIQEEIERKLQERKGIYEENMGSELEEDHTFSGNTEEKRLRSEEEGSKLVVYSEQRETIPIEESIHNEAIKDSENQTSKEENIVNMLRKGAIEGEGKLEIGTKIKDLTIKEEEESKGAILFEERKKKIEENVRQFKARMRRFFEAKYVHLLKEKQNELIGFTKTIDQLEEDNSYLKEIINTKNFEVFYYKSEMFNQKSNFFGVINSFMSEFKHLKNYCLNIRLLTMKERDDFLGDFRVLSEMLLEKVHTMKVSSEEKKKVIGYILEKKKTFLEKIDIFESAIAQKMEKTISVLEKIKRIRRILDKSTSKNKEEAEYLFRKTLKLYKQFLMSDKGSVGDIVKGSVFEEQKGFCLSVSFGPIEQGIKKETLLAMSELIGVSLVRMVEISKMIAKILKSFLVVEHRFPVKFNKIKTNYLRFVEFIEEFNEKIMNLQKEEQDSHKSVVERFSEGVDLLSLFIKQLFDYRKGLMLIGDKIRRNFEDLNILRENSVFKQVLMKDLERIQEMEKIKLAMVTKRNEDEEDNEEEEQNDIKKGEEEIHKNRLNKHLF